MTFLGVQTTGEKSLGTEFSACKTGMDQINVTIVMQFLSL